MKSSCVLPVVAVLILLSCNSAPPATETPATSVTTPLDTLNNRKGRIQAETILQDTAKKGLPLGAE